MDVAIKNPSFGTIYTTLVIHITVLLTAFYKGKKKLKKKEKVPYLTFLFAFTCWVASFNLDTT